MGFELRVTIAGICAFVENKNEVGPRVCVVMPSADSYRNALDDEVLCPHESYIEQGFAFGRTYLTKQRVKFIVGGGDNKPIELPLKTATKDKTGLIDLKCSPIFSTLPDTDPSIVYTSKQPAQIVMAQILLEKGSITFPQQNYFWDFCPNSERPGFLPAHEVVVTLAGLDCAKIVLEPFSGYGSFTIDVTPRLGISKVDLRIVNTCEKLNYPFKEPYRDRDFKWYYELVSNSGDALKKNGDLPIPRFKIPQLIGGNNCFPARLEPAPIA